MHECVHSVHELHLSKFHLPFIKGLPLLLAQPGGGCLPASTPATILQPELMLMLSCSRHCNSWSPAPDRDRESKTLQSIVVLRPLHTTLQTRLFPDSLLRNHRYRHHRKCLPGPISVVFDSVDWPSQCFRQFVNMVARYLRYLLRAASRAPLSYRTHYVHSISIGPGVC